MRGRKNTEADFWAKVDRRGPDECWEWQGNRMPRGYGQFSVKCTRWLTHRLVWVLTYGKIPEGLHVLHKCDNPACCNPAHLFLGTDADNVADMMAKGRQSKGPGLKGDRHPRAKLTRRDADDIRCLANILTASQVARMYGVSDTAVRLIWQGDSWSSPAAA